MALDYKNLPLLMTIEDIAEVFRCTPGTIRRRLASDPAWLTPVRHGLMRRQLFATVDVMAHLGHAAPAPATAPLQDAVDSWDPDGAAEALDLAARTRKDEQRARRHERYMERRAEIERRNSTEPAAARALALTWNRKVCMEPSEDWTTFRVQLRFQPRFRPEGWPAMIPIPRNGPEWVTMATDAEAEAIRSEIEEVMAEYQPLYDQMMDRARSVRKAARAQTKKPDA